MTSLGRVRIWHDTDGWGVIDSEVTPGGCWAHFSSILVAGYKTLTAGQQVAFTFEPGEQDGYAFRTREVWPADRAPVPIDEDFGPSAAYSSTLTVTFDNDDEDASSRP